jgi:hypothetical protein
MAKIKTRPTPQSATFNAVVTVQGDPTEGNFELSLIQVPAEERPPIEPPPIDPPVEPPVEPPDIEEPPATGWSPPDYLRTDTDKVSVPSIPRPAHLTAFKDPNFHTTITRISGDPGATIQGLSGARWGNECRHHYNSDQAWSPDERLIYLDTNNGGSPSSLFLDGETYRPAFAPQNKPSSADIRWDPANPDWMLCAAKNKLLGWNPARGEQVVIMTFDGFDDLTFGPWEGSPSRDGKLVVLTSDSQGVAFVYDIENDEKHPTIKGSKFGEFSDCRISRGGQYMVWKISPDEVFVTDFDGNEITHLPNNFVSHFDMAVDADGDEVLCGRVNSSSVNQGPSGYISKYRLKDGHRLGLQKGKGWSSHTSCRSESFYCVSAPTLEGGDYAYNGELIMCAYDGSNTWRLGHTHTNKDVSYVQETQPCHSPKGTRVIFASPWGHDGVGCYVCDFRG